MGEFFFVIKTLLLTVVIVMCLQIKIGSATIEQRSLSWMRDSTAVHALRGVAESAVVLGEESVEWVKKALEGEKKSSRKESGSSGKRSSKTDWAEEMDNSYGNEF